MMYSLPNSFSPPKLRRLVQLSPAGMLLNSYPCQPRALPFPSQPSPNLQRVPTKYSSLANRLENPLKQHTLMTGTPYQLPEMKTAFGETLTFQTPQTVIMSASLNKSVTNVVNVNFPAAMAGHSVPSGRIRSQAQGIPKSVGSTSLDVEGQLVDRAMTNLPEVFSEVYNMQKGQSGEIDRQQQLLKAIKESIVKGEQIKVDLLQEVSSVTNRIYLMEEDKKDSVKLCKEYEEEIQILVRECADLKHMLAAKQDEFEVETSLFETEKRKIKLHKFQVKEFESKTSEVQKKVFQVENKVEFLKKQQDDIKNGLKETEGILDGSAEKLETEKIKKIEDQCMQLEKNLNLKHDQIKDEGRKQKKIQQSIQVLHKRNAAQLTRLKRQLKEIQQRNRQWIEQISQLESNIAEIKVKLSE